MAEVRKVFITERGCALAMKKHNESDRSTPWQKHKKVLQKRLHALWQDILARPNYYVWVLCVTLLGYWVAGALALAFIGMPVHFASHAVVILIFQGYEQAVLLASLIVMIVIASAFVYMRGGLWAHIATSTIKILLLLAFCASTSLWIYQHFHRNDNIPLYPWDWYHLVVLHNPAVSAAKALTLISLGVVFGALAMVLLAAGKSSKSKLGHTHFASIWEVNKAGLFAKEGIVLAKAYQAKLRTPGFEGALVVAPMGSGKTTAVAIPNLIEWQGSVVVNDLKGELWTKTATYREKTLGQACYCWAPGEEKGSTWCYNPFSYVSNDKNLWYRDLQLIAQALIPESKEQASFWVQSSRDLFLLLGMYLFETSGIATLDSIYKLAKQEDFVGWLADIIEDGRAHFPIPLIHNASALLTADARTRSNILQDFFARITLFGDPIIQKNTRQNDFDLRELRKNPMSVYVHIPEREMERLSPLLTLFWVQLVDCLTVNEPNLDVEPYPVLALMDEFGNLARVDKFRKGLSFLRSYRIVFVIILQYLGQITSVYGRDDSAGFLNTKVKMIFTLTDKEDAKYFSEYLGQTTVKIRARSVSSGERSRGLSINESEHLRPLLRPEEILRLPSDDALILMEGSYPVRAKKSFWFKDRDYKTALEDCQESHKGQ